jgi:diadenosine tetraphosphate (Ap4A) HIT family hydrolase
MCDLTTDERMTLMREIEICEKAMMHLFQPTQTNVAMIGNITPQLHVHIVCRFQGDLYWPDVIWGMRARPYLSTLKYQTIDRIKEEILASCPK